MRIAYFFAACISSCILLTVFYALKLYEAKSKTHPEPDQRDYLKREVDRLRRLLTVRTSVSGLLTGAQDALAAYLDSEHGASISDYKIFESLPRRMEEEFHNDMRALNVGSPSIHQIPACVGS